MGSQRFPGSRLWLTGWRQGSSGSGDGLVHGDPIRRAAPRGHRNGQSRATNRDIAADYPVVVRHNVWSRPAGLARATEARFVTARRGATIVSAWYGPRVRHADSLVTGGDYSVCVCWL